MNPYVRNLWYMAAWEEEVVGDALLGRILLDEDWLIFRKGDGSFAMLSGLCPHRFAPLHKGKRTGDTVACPYHGLEFEADGACSRNPFGDPLPPHARLRTLPIIARYGALWFWPGVTEKADPATIPDFTAIDAGAPIVRDKTLFNANYEIVADNLMDLSHAEFIHTESFATSGKFFKGEYEASDTEDGAIWSKIWMPETEAAPWMGFPEGTKLDEWIEMRWHAPASMLLEVGQTFHGRPRDAAGGPPMINPHILTPETSSSTHYFYTRFPGDESAAMAHRVFETEDRPMLEDIQRSMRGRGLMEMNPVILSVDAAAIRVRRKLMQMRNAETGNAVQPHPPD
jgi:phenylpropionate dioxygenase-like ring-hydroxylating dioxygenase large terminal subunit